MKQIIERGASWTLEETKLLLVFWGQDLIKRLRSKAKRTKEVYEKISQKFAEHGYERTADQIRTRIFNMIAEYRRILKDPNPERMKKCVFFDTVHRLYNAHDMKDVKSAIDEYEPDFPNSPPSNALTSDKGEESISDSESIEGDDTFNNTTASTANNNNNNGGSNDDSNQAPNNTNANDEDNNHNLNTDKESSSAATGQAEGVPAKKLKLESPKNNHGRTNSNQAKDSAPSATSSSAFSVDNQNASTSKASKTSASASGQTSGSSSNSLPSSQLSSQRHQSLLLPHATTSSASTSSPSNTASTSTPISKLTTSTASTSTPSYININSTKLPIIRANQIIGHSNGNESINLNGTTTRLPTTAAITSHQLYQAPVTTFDVTSSALLIDRMFAHLSRESENMREWIALEKERLVLEKSRRQQEIEREAKRERILVDALMRYQDQWLSYMSRLDSSILENVTEPPPTLKIPPRETASTTDTSQANQSTVSISTNTTTTNTTVMSSSNSANPSGSTNESSAPAQESGK